MKRKRNPITEKIREKYGTVTHFCKVKGINLNTFKVVILGNGKSEKIAKILKEENITLPVRG